MGRHGSKNAFFFCGTIFGIIIAVGVIIMAVGNLIDDRNYPYQYPFKVPNVTSNNNNNTTPPPTNSTPPPPPPSPPGGSSSNNNNQPPAVIINMAGLVVSDHQITDDDNTVDLCHEQYFLPLDGNPIDASPPPPTATRLRWTTHFYLDGLVTIPSTIRRINTTHDDTLLSVLLVLDLAEKATPDPAGEDYHPRALVFNTNGDTACGNRLMNCNIDVVINTTERPLIISSSDKLDPLVNSDNDNSNDLLFRFYYNINRAQLLRLSDSTNPVSAQLLVFATYVAANPDGDNDQPTSTIATASVSNNNNDGHLTCTMDADCMTSEIYYATTQLVEERFIRIPDVLCSARPIATGN